MKHTNKCPKCGSEYIINDAKPDTMLEHVPLVIATREKPGALLFKGRKATGITACVCSDCGFIELYADDPKSIRV